MERNEISRHEVEVFRVLSEQNAWTSNSEITALTNNVASRTVRATTVKLVATGIVDQAEVFPGHRFKISPHAKQRNRGYLDRLLFAAEVFGISITRP